MMLSVPNNSNGIAKKKQFHLWIVILLWSTDVQASPKIITGGTKVKLRELSKGEREQGSHEMIHLAI